MYICFHHINLPISETWFDALQKKASVSRLQRALRYHHRDDQVRCLLADQVLKDALNQLNMSTAYHSIKTTHYGKPVFSCNDIAGPVDANDLIHLTNENHHFNLSHSGQWVACIIDSQPVGIDVERSDADIDHGVIELFSAEEQAYINTLTQQQKPAHIYRLWTLKESYLKAIGTGLYQPLDTFSIKLVDKHYAQLVIDKKVQDQWYFYSFNLDITHTCGICAKKPINPCDFKIILN